MRYSKQELKELLLAWIAISLAFTIVLYQAKLSENIIESYLLLFLLSLITVGVGFLLHELGHKFLAQKYKLFAEFRAFKGMLLLTLLISFLGFVFAAPGAVFIHGNVDKKKNGKISLMGPAVNLVLAGIFLLISLFATGFFKDVGNFGVKINSWLALFNMIPFWNFDGKKVWDWNKFVWFAVVIMGIVLLFVKI
ncbi:MAG TPA: hypothetical protein VJJ23_02705 [Candidatus Nanoarchaeia archaeon]|nr:hypothetical protein [Candidatus Nanoarchaeia archaeon]